jgi:hypothetical protein
VIVLHPRRSPPIARRLDVAGAIRMRDVAGLDVMQVAADDDLWRLLASCDRSATELVVDAVYALCLPDADARGWTSRQFGRRLVSYTPREFAVLLLGDIRAFFALPGPPRKQTGSRLKITAEVLWGDVYALAGEVGIDPDPHTYGELVAQATGRSKAEWARTATLQAQVINSNKTDGLAVQPADLDPTGGLKESSGSRGMEIDGRDALFAMATAFCSN